VKSYLESLKYQKGIRVIHDFHGDSIVSVYEVSVKSAYLLTIKEKHFYICNVIFDGFIFLRQGNFCTVLKEGIQTGKAGCHIK